jgi:crotonobetainyl-CoA:carnitine CoA-transferase CaiB-like acyl-CoA transferase
VAGKSLDGVRVLDLSRVLAGPLCTQMLADHGADVIKIESPAGDDTRWLGPPFGVSGDAAYFSAVNRGKRAIGLDLAGAEGKALLFSLLEHSDVLVENFIPGTMKRWGLDYQHDLAERFPRLIFCSISGFGADGPMGGLPGYDAVLQAICGLMSINGEAAGGPTRIGVPIVDHLTGYTALTGILLALNERHRTGRGQAVEATLFDAALSLLVPHAANWLSSGETPRLLGSAHPNIAPYDKFRCADGEVFLGILNDGQFRKFAECVERPGLAVDARFTNNTNRIANRPALRLQIEEALGAWPRARLCDRLMQCGVPAGPVNTVSEALSQPHTRHRDMVVDRGGYRGMGVPVRLSRTPGAATLPPPAYAQHTDEVMAESGIPAEKIAALHRCGVLPEKPNR